MAHLKGGRALLTNADVICLRRTLRLFKHTWPLSHFTLSVSYTLEVLREGSLMHTKGVSEKDHYRFGRTPDCDVVLEHPSASRLHAVIQYNGDTKVCECCLQIKLFDMTRSVYSYPL
jgi:pSer/pThr/pTyr-binding forkhead associated (FHA) protein